MRARRRPSPRAAGSARRRDGSPAARPAIAVVGSLNVDMVVRSPRLPEVGETISGSEFAMFPGGKGANQALAAARLGARVAMVGCVGGDTFGPRLREGLASEGIDVAHVRVDPEAATGVAFITVDAQGRNTIVVAPGANLRLSADDVLAARRVVATASVLLVQLEVPLDAIHQAVRLAGAAGCRVILDPAPPQPLPADLYPLLSVINPNEVEARFLTGVAPDDDRSAAEAADRLLARGAKAAVIKLGARGAYLATPQTRGRVGGIPVEAVDSTAAGDAFAGALAVALAEGKTLAEAVRFANAAAALSVTRMGAQPAMPRRDEVEAFAAARDLAI
ncbi:MAG: ribokinase [Armatimonadota bacterium]|nr:ribokinase [Armatimonadota bacterium]